LEQIFGILVCHEIPVEHEAVLKFLHHRAVNLEVIITDRRQIIPGDIFAADVEFLAKGLFPIHHDDLPMVPQVDLELAFEGFACVQPAIFMFGTRS